MRHSRFTTKVVATMVAMVFCFIAVVVAPVQATMVGTADILQSQDRNAAREKVTQFLERWDVAQQLAALGVPASEAMARVQAMTDAEIERVADKIDQLPAGGNIYGFVLGAAFVAFMVLIVLDIMGVTDIFTFIKKG